MGDSLFLEDLSMVIQAIYENGVFRSVERVDLPDNVQVEIVIQGQPTAVAPSIGALPLAKLAAIAHQHTENPDLPTDLAEQHDHYLYGSSKQS